MDYRIYLHQFVALQLLTKQPLWYKQERSTEHISMEVHSMKLKEKK